MADKGLEDARIVTNSRYRGDYFQLIVAAPLIADRVQPGQFVHLQLPDPERFVLRRPFSVCDADPGTGLVTVLYKCVGQGTDYLSRLPAGQVVSLLGPLGHGFPPPMAGQWPVIVAGGYGCAATYLVAKRAPLPGVCLLGGRQAADILLDDWFTAARFDVRVATDDGSRGQRGVVTALLGPALAAAPGGRTPVVYACGPNAMLAAVARLCGDHGVTGYLSVDEHLVPRGGGLLHVRGAPASADRDRMGVRAQLLRRPSVPRRRNRLGVTAGVSSTRRNTAGGWGPGVS